MNLTPQVTGGADWSANRVWLIPTPHVTDARLFLTLDDGELTLMWRRANDAEGAWEYLREASGSDALVHADCITRSALAPDRHGKWTAQP